MLARPWGFAAAAAAVVVLGVLNGATVVTASLELHSLEGVNPLAQCTDGTPAGYYWKPAASNASSNLYIMYLEGGGWCWDEASCAHRCGTPSAPKTSQALCSSAGWNTSMDVEGLFWPTSTLLRDANKIFVHYCTSDAHMGNATAFGWQFRGAVVVQAILEDLVARYGLGRAGNTLVFGGGSAGGRGAMVHLDAVAERMLSQYSVTVTGFLDSPLWIDMQPFPGVPFIGLPGTTQGVFKYANISPDLLDEDCVAKYPAPDTWRCIFGEYRMPFVSTPYLLVASLNDAFQLGSNVGHRPSTAAELAYAANFSAATSAVVRSLHDNWPASSPPNAVLSWACFNHDVSVTDDDFDTITCQGVSQDTGLMAVYKRGQARDLEWVDTCSGFNCGSGCS